jgi:hypothetical protein
VMMLTVFIFVSLCVPGSSPKQRDPAPIFY